MRTDVPAPVDPQIVSRSGVTVTLFDEGTPLDLILGTEGLATRDLTPYVENLSQTSDSATFTLRFRDEFSGVNRLRSGQLVQIAQNGFALFNGIVHTIPSSSESRGERYMSITIQRRDSTPWWREVRRVGPQGTVGADLGFIAREVAEQLELSVEEYDLRETGIVTAHNQTHIVELNAWEMLELLLQPALLEPYVDARGILRAVSRDVNRPTDIELDNTQIKTIEDGFVEPAVTRFRVTWMGPELVEVTQQQQVLAQCEIHAGVIHGQTETVRVRWGKGAEPSIENNDERPLATSFAKMRARDTALRIHQGMGFLGSERFVQTSPFDGYVETRIDTGFMILAVGGTAATGTSLVTLIIAASTARTGLPGADIAANIMLMLLLIALSYQRFCVYEIRGTPYDYVYPQHEVEAYDDSAPVWSTKQEETQNDFIPNQTVADTLAVNELIYRSLESQRAATILMSDDLRIERGDILGLPDGRRFYTQDYSRNLKRGEDALLSVKGFFL